MQVSRLGFGCGGLSGIYNAPLSHEEGCSIIKEIFNKGVTFFDTSDLYGDNHDNEIMVGKVTHYATNYYLTRTSCTSFEMYVNIVRIFELFR